MSNFRRPDPRKKRPFNQSHSGMSKHDLERDSGFSDASSEYLSAVEYTDSEDAGRFGSAVGQVQTGLQAAVLGGSNNGPSPMIIMNNFVLNQTSSMAQPEKQWGFPSPMQVLPQSQVVLLQPMASNGTTSSSDITSANMRQSKSYMPILKSYPKIAPHPVDTLTKRAGSSKARVRAATVYEQRHRRNCRGQKLGSMTVQPILSFEAATNPAETAENQGHHADDSFSSPVGTSGMTSATHADELKTVMDSNGMHIDKYQDVQSVHNSKLKRFSNTYNILSKSGLLDITMRTKQLIKENKRTQGQLQQLQQQTALLLEALSSGDPNLWIKLEVSLQNTENEQWGNKAQDVLA
ncbi:CLOCK-interacting pacemaker a [Pholidichthys leucotaenia]